MGKIKVNSKYSYEINFNTWQGSSATVYKYGVAETVFASEFFKVAIDEAKKFIKANGKTTVGLFYEKKI